MCISITQPLTLTGIKATSCYETRVRLFETSPRNLRSYMCRAMTVAVASSAITVF